MGWHVISSLCHACYISDCVYLHIFRINWLLKRQLFRGHRISCHAPPGTDWWRTIQWTDRANTYKQVGQFPIKTGWRDSTLVFCNLAKAFKHNIVCDSIGIQAHNHLVRKRTLNHFAQLVEWLTCVMSTYLCGIRLNFGYRTCFKKAVVWHSRNYRVHIHSKMRTWHDNNIQGLHFPGAIEIVATMIHYCYCLIHCCYCFESEE